MGTGLILGLIWVIPNMSRIPLGGSGSRTEQANHGDSWASVMSD